MEIPRTGQAEHLTGSRLVWGNNRKAGDRVTIFCDYAGSFSNGTSVWAVHWRSVLSAGVACGELRTGVYAV